MQSTVKNVKLSIYLYLNIESEISCNSLISNKILNNLQKYKININAYLYIFNKL